MKIAVLDHGYVRLVERFGSDLSIVNAARVSYAREHTELQIGTPTEDDSRLLRYLLRHQHWSPFRHAFLQLEVKCPLCVAREWWKHVVGAATVEAGTAWNEVSRRYADSPPEFYIPTEWRRRSRTNKQGSEPGGISPSTSAQLSTLLETLCEDGARAYQSALRLGVAPELARLFLPAYGLYTTFRWTASVQATLHFVTLRQHEAAQWEIRQYAQAVQEVLAEAFPETWAAWQEVHAAAV